MTNCITNFFDAWQIQDDELRLAKITSAVTESIQYDDPRTSDTLIGIPALNSYVAMFAENAPGWTAKVVKSDTIGKLTRVTVAFSGKGPDGNENTQLGQYFVEQNEDLVSRMVGFVGTGELA